MELLFALIQLLCVVQTVFGHPVDVSDEKKLNMEYSLPDLLKTNTIPENWVAGDATELKEGRLVLTPEQGSVGSLWSKKSYVFDNSFVLEWTFRSVNFMGQSKGGMSLWFVTEKTNNNQKLYNGPSKFDGLQILVDNNGPIGATIRSQLNDGSEEFNKESIYSKTFASCLMAYQDSSVPSTARLTYDMNDNHLLKLQIDNRVCFQTRKVRIPAGNFRIGVTAENADNAESFEILKLKVYDGVIEKSLIPNVNAMSQPKMLTKIIDKTTGKEKLIEKSAFDASTEQITNFDLYKKMDRVEGKVLANDIHELQTQVNDLLKKQDDLTKYITHLTQLLEKRYETQDSKGKNSAEEESYKEFYSMNEKLEKMILEQEKLRETARQQHPVGPHIDEIVRKLIIWLMPLIFIMTIMAYYTFRIRQEIVKTKLL